MKEKAIGKLDGVDPRQIWGRVEKRFQRMTKTQKANTLVEAGIVRKGDYRELPPYKGVLATVDREK